MGSAPRREIFLRPKPILEGVDFPIAFLDNVVVLKLRLLLKNLFPLDCVALLKWILLKGKCLLLLEKILSSFY